MHKQKSIKKTKLFMHLGMEACINIKVVVNLFKK